MNLRFRSSIRFKATLVVLITCALALVLTIGAFVVYEYFDTRSRAVNRFGALARVTGDNCASALAFRDARTAGETLHALSADPRVLGAAVYSRDGRIFARYSRPGAEVPFPAAPTLLEHDFAPHRLSVSRPIQLERRVLGTIHLVAEMNTQEKQVADFARLGGASLAVSLFFAAFVAFRLQRVVTDPALRLADAAQEVADRKDYSVRVEPASPDEIGVLTANFNQMLAQIELNVGALRESENRFAVAVAAARDGIWDWQLESGRVYYSPRFKQILGYAESEFADSPEEWSDRIHPEDAPRVRVELEEHLAGRVPTFETEYRMRHRSGGWVWVFVRGLALCDETGRATRIAGSLTDVTERKGRDVLTGLPNRLLFTDRVESALARARGRAGHDFSVLCVDLERLKAINDALGRAAGRDFLLAAAARIRGAIETRDTLARLDLGEFAILLEDIGDPARAARISARIQAVLAQGFRVAEQEVFTTAAVGIASSASGYERAEDLLRDAEAALERARARGWNRFEVFDESVRARALARLELENELRRAVESGGLEIQYQPIIALEGQRLAGFEALARWKRQNGVQVAPGEFIALAEETGIIAPLGSWVLRRALRQLREWHEMQGEPRGLMVSVNLSGRQLSRPELIEEVEAALAEAGVPPRALKLEITESALIEELEPAGAALRDLTRLGVGFWLDDFGTGYSSLSYLHHFPLEALKIDRSFVSALNGDPERRAIVRAILGLARALGMKSVAEGVETDGQLRRLSSLHCDYAQGHAVSLPLGRDSVAQLLRGLALPTLAG